MSVQASEEAMALESQREATRLGDPTTWVDRYGDALHRFALSRVGRQEVAEDLVQETFLAGWQARAAFDGRASLGTWLGGILRRKVADYYRRNGRERARMEVEASDQAGPLFGRFGKWLDGTAPWRESPEQMAENAEFWGVVAACLGELPSHLAEAFALRELRQETFEEVSTQTGITPKNLSVRLHRARLLLRRCLDRRWFRGTV